MERCVESECHAIERPIESHKSRQGDDLHRWGHASFSALPYAWGNCSILVPRYNWRFSRLLLAKSSIRTCPHNLERIRMTDESHPFDCPGHPVERSIHWSRNSEQSVIHSFDHWSTVVLSLEDWRSIPGGERLRLVWPILFEYHLPARALDRAKNESRTLRLTLSVQ